MNRVIEDALSLLSEGFSITLPVDGNSMLPFIIGGRESVILATARPSELHRGMVVLAWVEQRRYVLHRIEKIKGNKVTLMGDGNLSGREHCTLDDVKAIATHVVDASKKKHDLYTPWRCRASELWCLLLPVRRYLLAIMKMFGVKRK